MSSASSKDLPPLDVLRSVLSYNSETGEFANAVKRGSRAMPGKIAGATKQCGRVIIQIHGVEYKAHRLAWLAYYGSPPEMEIDHINRNASDNRICNLRCVSRTTNMVNRGVGRNNSSGTVGVRWFKPMGKWKSEIGVGGRIISLGYFDNKQEAIDRRKLAELMYHSTVLVD